MERHTYITVKVIKKHFIIVLLLSTLFFSVFLQLFKTSKQKRTHKFTNVQITAINM